MSESNKNIRNGERMKKYNLQDEYLAVIDEFGSFEDYTFFEHLKNREIIINQQIDDTIVERAIMQIIKWNQEDSNIPIKIYLNTVGGDLFLGMVLCEVIQKSKIPVHVYILGMAASMGALIAIAGHKTYAYEYSNILLHDGSTVLQGTSNKVKDTVKFYEEKDEQIKNFILNNTKITEEKYDEMADREWWMTAKTAKELGIIDEIIS